MEVLIGADSSVHSLPVSEDYIEAIFTRLDNILPYKSGFSIAQIDVDPIYTQSKIHLKKILGTAIHLQDLVTCCYNVILNIIASDNQKTVEKMKDITIKSLYIMLSLLSSFLITITSKDIMRSPTVVLLKAAGLTTAPQFYNRAQYMIPSANKLSTALVQSLLKILGYIKSDHDSLVALRSQCESQVLLDPSKTSGTMLEELRTLRRLQSEEHSFKHDREILDGLESKILDIFLYISLNEGNLFLRYLETIFKRFNAESLYVTKMSILKTAHFSKDNFHIYLALFRNIFHIISRASQRALLMYFFSSCIYEWAIFRTDDFLLALSSPQIINLTDSLFDIVYKTSDFKTYTKTYYKMLSCLMFFQAKEFEKFSHDQKSKSTSQLLKRSMVKMNPVSFNNNLKQKFLLDFVTLVKKAPESGTTFTKFLLVCCALETIDKDNILAKFVHCQYENLCLELQMNRPEYVITPSVYYALNITPSGASNSMEASSPSPITATSTSSSKGSSTISQTSSGASSAQSRSVSNSENVSSTIQSRILLQYKQLINKLRVETFAITCMIDTHEMINRMIQIFGNLDSSFSMLATLSGGLKLLITIPLLAKKIFPYLQNATPSLTRYLRLTASRIVSQKKLAVVTPLNTDSSTDSSRSFTETVTTEKSISSHPLTSSDSGSSKSNNNSNSMGIWAGPSSSSSSNNYNTTSNVTSSRPNSTLKMASKSLLHDRIKHPHKINTSSTIPPPQADKQSDPTSLAASLNSQFGTITHISPFNEELSSIASQETSTSSDNEEPDLFKIEGEFSTVSFTSSVPKGKLRYKKIIFNAEEMAIQHRILINILDLYKALPFLCYPSVEKYPNSDFPNFEYHFKKFIDPIASLLTDPDKLLVASVKNFLSSFCQSVSNKDVLRVFTAYVGTSILIDSIAKVGLAPTIADKQRDDIIQYMLQLLEWRSSNSNLKMMLENKNVIETVHASGACGRIIKNFERCIYLGLFSNDIDTVRNSRRLLSFWVFVVTNPHHHDNCLDKSNLHLAKQILADRITVSSLAIKKKLRDHFARLTEPNAVLLDVWSLMYEKLMLDHDFAQVSNSVNDEAIDEYLGSGDDIVVYTEYMASLGGIIMSPHFVDDLRQVFLQKRLELFLNFKIANLFSSNVRQREHCREIICVSVHPYLCGTILELAKKYLPRFELSLKKKEYSICEVFLSIIRAISMIEIDSLFLHAVELWHVNYQILKMLNINDNDPAFLKLKLKFCKLQVVFLSKLDILSLTGNILKKNEYARIAADYLENSFNFDKDYENDSKGLFSWNESSTKKINNKLQELKKGEIRDLHLDIKVETSMILKLIFYKLPLDTPRSSGEETAAGVIFSNYFNIFVRLLEKLNDEDFEEMPLSNQHRSSTIIRDIIQALINLLLANPDIGLKYALPLGYHSNELIRVSFINVFSSIVKEIKPDFMKKDLSLMYKDVLEVLVSDESLLLATAKACPKSEIETFANALMEANPDEATQLKMMMALMKYDISSTTDANEIMRSNTVGTRLVSFYSGNTANPYLIHILRPIFQELLNSREFFEIEKIDKMTEKDKENNVKYFFKYLNLIANSISESADKLPAGIKLVSKTIFDATSEQLPEARFVAISSFLFLRLINPVIVSPERAGIVKSVDVSFKRSLIQLARVIQLIVNKRTIKLPLIESKINEIYQVKEKLWKFMDDVVSIDVDREIENVSKQSHNPLDITYSGIYSNENVKNCGLYFHSFFYDNWMHIRQVYAHFGDKLSSSGKVKLIAKIDKTMEALGLPQRIKGYSIPSYIRDDRSEKGLLLYDFLSKSSLTETSGDYVKILLTKDGLPLLVISALDFDEDVTAEKLAYSILVVLVKYWQSPYCILWDLTGFNNVTLFSETINIFHEMNSTKYLLNFKRLYMLNMSPEFYEGFKLCDHLPLALDYSNPEYVFINSDDDIKSLNKNGLMGYSSAVTNDARVVFRDVSLYQNIVKRFVPVKLKIGNLFVQISTDMAQQLKIRNKMHVVRLVDYYRLKDLEEISSSSFTGVSNEISMIDAKRQSRIILSSPKKIEIMRTLYFSRARLNNNEYSIEEEYKSGFNSSFSVGHLLNICFTGLLSRYDNIRNASYSLLTSITSSAKLNSGRTVDYVEGVVFPDGDTEYINSISTNISRNHPELTYSFLTGFFKAFENASTYTKNIVILYVSPWISNIHQHVYLNDPIKGTARTKHLIRKLVQISRTVNNRQACTLLIWPHLSVEDDLVELTIDEIVAASIDHEAEGGAWDDLTRNWALRPTLRICNVLIRRLKAKVYETKNDESSIETHTRWIETTVLVSFLAHLTFDSLLFVEKYISDIFFIVTIYMDYGPLELRHSLLKLLNRTFHCYLSKHSLTKEKHKIIEQNIELMSSARFKLLFGLTREDDDMSGPLRRMSGPDTVNNSNSVSSLCEIFTLFLFQFSDREEYELQLIKWQSYLLKIAFNNNLQFQVRSILVLGSLTKEGISGFLVSKFLKLIETTSTSFIKDQTCGDKSYFFTITITALHSFSKAIEGVREDSIFHALIFWMSYAIMCANNVIFVQFAARYLKTSLIKIANYLEDENVSILDYLFKKKQLLDPYLKEYESLFNIQATPENFDSLMFALIAKGLTSPYSAKETHNMLLVFLKYRYHDTKKFPDRYDDNSYCHYLFFVYMLCSSNEDMILVLKDLDMEDVKLIKGYNEVLVPEVLTRYPQKQSVTFFSGCGVIAKFFDHAKIDEVISSRVITIYIAAFEHSSISLLSVFDDMKGLLMTFLKESTTINLLQPVLDMLTKLMTSPEYENRVEYRAKVVFHEGFAGFVNFDYLGKDPFYENSSEGFEKIKQERYELIRQMMIKTNDYYLAEL